jgi:hypothetical protein
VSVPTALVSEDCRISGWIWTLPALAGAVQEGNEKHKRSASPSNFPVLDKTSPQAIEDQFLLYSRQDKKERRKT